MATEVQAELEPPRVLANIGTYSELIDAFRNRAAERHIAVTSPAVHQVAGLADCYIAKLLAVNPVKKSACKVCNHF